MAKGSFVATVVLALLAGAVLLTVEAAVDCGKARGQLAPCSAYLTGSAPSPSGVCCKGVQYIKDNTVTKEDRQATCQCLKDTAAAIPNLKDSAAEQLPEQCHITINVPISKTVDCNNLP